MSEATEISHDRAGAAGGPAPRPRSPGWAVLRLAVVVAAIVAALIAAGFSALVLFIAALVVIVVLHELGHYVTAKWSGMKVTEFFVGFGPRLWFVRKGETDYGLKPILAGAYVKIPGMTNIDEVDPADEARTYRRKPFRLRLLVASAGSIMHFVIAFVLAWVLVVSFGVPSGSQAQVDGFTPWPGHRVTAAELAGVRVGDRILAVDGTRLTTPGSIGAAIQEKEGRPVTLTVTSRGQVSRIVVRPQAGHKVGNKEVLGPGPSGNTDWLIGIEVGTATVFSQKNPAVAVAWAGRDVGVITAATVTGFGHVFSPGGLSTLFRQVTNSQVASKAAAHPVTSNRILSIVETARLATQAEEAGMYYFLSILIALNIALGLLNMLPMLPLDGGHVVIALYERIRTRRGRPYYQADVAKLLPVAYAFMAVLLLVVGSAVFLDIAHPLANPFG